MLDGGFDPDKFIDREFEMELFERLLRFESKARILAIQDGGGMGKSLLLEMFRYRCRTASRPRIPVSLVKLDQLADETPLSMVRAIVRDLRAYDISFPNFTKYEHARVGGDFATICTARSVFHLENANFANAELRIANVNIERAEKLSVNSGGVLNHEQDAIARDICLQAFLEDIQKICTELPGVVILLDAYEHCATNLPHLRRWFIQTFLERAFFKLAKRPDYLLLVLSGQELPHFMHYWARVECETVVESVAQLRIWERRHVAEWLRIYRPGCPDHMIETFYDAFQEGRSPKQVTEILEKFLEET
jgi:hypothetical protein